LNLKIKDLFNMTPTELASSTGQLHALIQLLIIGAYDNIHEGNENETKGNI
jgi:hypothetical protein